MKRRGQGAATRPWSAIAQVVLVSVAMSGCIAPARTQYDSSDLTTGRIPGFDGIRVWGDGTLADFARAGIASPKPVLGQLNYLALSGGGSGGAFGAGILAGWSKAGTRPSFQLVSGVSTGALIAPFAFLGSQHDDTLREIYTGGSAENLVRMRPILAGLLGSGFLQGEPLRDMVAQYATPDLLDAIAREHRKGRRLFVVTTNMDAQRPVVWDMGKIAASEHPKSLELFRDVLTASASIPAVFPPILIEAEANGRAFSEMHADGATSTSIFTIPDGVFRSGTGARPPPGVRARLFLIVNNTLAPEFDLVRNNTLAVGGRGISTLTKAQTRSYINYTFAFAQRANIDFNLATITTPVPYNATNPFDQDYMKRLFEIGYDQALDGSIWRKRPEFDLAPR